MTGAQDLPVRLAPGSQDYAAAEFVHHSSGLRTSTDIVIADALRKQYPSLKLTVSPQQNANLLGFAGAGHAQITPLDDVESFSWREYLSAGSRIGGQPGVLLDAVQFGKYMYKWNDHDIILYIVDGRDGNTSYPQIINQYILSSTQRVADDLITEAAKFSSVLHNEVWVFDQGYWQKSAELWQSVQKSEWEDVILDKDMKKAIITDVEQFFDSRDTYEKLKVPWKRGIIYYGPPGNGKTISIKAMMHSLYKRKEPIPTLYVRTLVSYAGPEYSLSQIFGKARKEAPCYLVFEDLDSIVNDRVRSYFLNEVDGLRKNDGILMVGSTNHLDRLDPGIAKRPSRFDRKYLFPDPNFAERVQYCHFWQSKLSDNKDIDFPDELCNAIARITDKFSFAYIQEAFVAALLAIATAEKGDIEYDGGDKLEEYVLWREMKKQVKILRDEIEGEKEGGSSLIGGFRV